MKHLPYYLDPPAVRQVYNIMTRKNGVSIRPTVPVSVTVQGLAEGRDEVLEKGLEVVCR